MKTGKILLAWTVFTQQLLLAQNVNRITGPLGVYHMTAGYTYADGTGIDSTLVQYEFRFGELCFPSQSLDGNFGFVPEIDSCINWRPNKILGIIQPPTEHGIFNQPSDTALYAPLPLLSGPGMVQGGQRFSKLSQLYGGYCGVILDDWNGDTIETGEIRDAVRGKYVDAEGNVYSDSLATTPYNKLYVVRYNADYVPGITVIDGISLWYDPLQSCCYYNLDNDISTLQANFPHKEILVGVYLRNSAVGWTAPVSVQYMIQHALNRYNVGDVNGIIIFTEGFLAQDIMTPGHWDSIGLPYLLDTIYYPYLGQGHGKIYDCYTGNVLRGASIHIYCKAKLTGDTLLRSAQITDTSGQYQFGLWAGNGNTDSTYYWLIADKPGYLTNSMGFWIKRNDTTLIPDLPLCPVPAVPANALNMIVYPNPSPGNFTVVIPAQETGSELEIFNMLGAKIYSTPARAYTNIDISNEANGIYVLLVKSGGRKVSQKVVVVR